MHNYSFQRVQGLQGGRLDRRRRRRFCRWLLRKQRRDENFVHNILFTDECRFAREATWNFRNEHYWNDRNLFLVMPRNFQGRFSVNLWAGIVNGRLIGPFQIDGSLNGPNYNHFLHNHLPRLLRAQGVNPRRIWLMQDGHPAHRTQDNLMELRNLFGNRVISMGARREWPARSPDLNPLDFFLWGHLKSRIYQYPLENIEQLRQRITEALNTVTPEMLQRCEANLLVRSRLCIDRRGGYFEPRLPQ